MELFKKSLVYSYLMVFEASRETEFQLAAFKKLFVDSFGEARFTKNSKPHLSLFSFQLSDEIKDSFFNQLQSLVWNEKSFQIKLQNFDLFEAGNLKTIYAKVTDFDELKSIHDKIRTLMLNFKGIKKSDARKLSQPHFTIAQTSNITQFENAWKYFKDLEFEQTFEVSRILVLKYNEGYSKEIELQLEV